MISWLHLLGGLALLLLGGDLLVRGASSLARALGVPALVIGLTVLAFGTSAPELAVNVVAAVRDRGAITFGNVIGSNIANMGLVLGLTALVTPLRVHRSILIREIPVMLAVTGGTVLMAFDLLPWRQAGGFGTIDGAVLLAGFALFLAYTTRTALKDRAGDHLLQEAEQEEELHRPLHWAWALIFTGTGLTGVLLGSHWTVEGATEVARDLGLSEVVIGLTIIALGTSLPELVTSMFAALKGHSDMALGNVVGSNVFNLLFILGVSATIGYVPVPERGAADLLVLAAFSVILLPLSFNRRKLTRFEGTVLLLGYLSYMAWRSLLAGQP